MNYRLVSAQLIYIKFVFSFWKSTSSSNMSLKGPWSIGILRLDSCLSYLGVFKCILSYYLFKNASEVLNQQPTAADRV